MVIVNIIFVLQLILRSFVGPAALVLLRVPSVERLVATSLALPLRTTLHTPRCLRGVKHIMMGCALLIFHVIVSRATSAFEPILRARSLSVILASAVSIGLPSKNIIKLRVILIFDVEIVPLLILLLLRWEGYLATRLRLIKGFCSRRPLYRTLSSVIWSADRSLATNDLIVVSLVAGPSDALSLFALIILRLLLHFQVSLSNCHWLSLILILFLIFSIIPIHGLGHAIVYNRHWPLPHHLLSGGLQLLLKIILIVQVLLLLHYLLFLQISNLVLLRFDLLELSSQLIPLIAHLPIEPRKLFGAIRPLSLQLGVDSKILLVETANFTLILIQLVLQIELLSLKVG